MKLSYNLVLLSCLVASANATTLKDVVKHTLEKNSDILSKSYNNESYKKYIDEQEGGYYPTVDLKASIESRNTEEDPGSNIKQNGYSASLNLQQVLYNGGLTSSLVDEAKASYESNQFKNSNDVENIVLDSVNAYLNILKFEERVQATNYNIANHNKYLEIAVQTEIINGAVLDKVQTKAKINQAKVTLFEEMKNKQSALSSFKKNVGMRIDANMCKPAIDESLIPQSFDALIKTALKSNYSLMEQSKNIEIKRALVKQSDAKFKPTVNLNLNASLDDDLTNEDIYTNTYSAVVEMNYNLYNGGSDKSANEKERLALREAQEKYDVVSKAIEDELRNAYESYKASKKQAEQLKELIVNNQQIISIYKDQFDAGTRSFIDVLNVEADLYSSKINLINTEYAMYQSYYAILKTLSSLKTEVLKSSQIKCNDPRIQTKEPAQEMDLLKEATSS